MQDEITRQIIDCPELRDWPDIERIVAQRKPGTATLFQIAYATTGNDRIDPLPIQAAVACFTVSCILIDDVLDEDAKGIWQRYGAGRVANLAAALQARQQILVHRSGFSDDRKQSTTFQLNQMALLLARAQELATQDRPDLAQYWSVVHGKSGNVCGTAMRIGALLGEATPDEAEILYAIGRNLGEVGQISNDLRGAFDERVNPDWQRPGSSLPILIALITEHPYRDELNRLLADGLGQNGGLQTAQDLLVKCGAVRACCDEISRRLEAMYQGLVRCALPGRAHLCKNIGEDIQHAVQWIRDLETELSEETTRTLDDLSVKLASLRS